MKSESAFLLFVFGAAIGAAVAWKLARTKYETIANDEIASVKKAYQKERVPAVPEASVSENITKEIKRYTNIVNDTKYSNGEEAAEPIKDAGDYPPPYIITPEEFAGNFEYDTIEITYFADGVLADENNEPIEDIDNTVGSEAVRHFGEYEPDSVYVRNERLKCDYEILRDERRYADIKRPKTKEE